jgi:NAD(P)-dependent dehydrogenase (short-subunit alcohol dehydrogenase family)
MDTRSAKGASISARRELPHPRRTGHADLFFLEFSFFTLRTSHWYAVFLFLFHPVQGDVRRLARASMKRLFPHLLCLIGAMSLLISAAGIFLTTVPRTDPSLEEVAQLRSYWHAAWAVGVFGIVILSIASRGIFTQRKPSL